MNVQSKVMKPLLLLLVLVSFSACSGYYRQTDSYVRPSGSVKVLESDRESCVSSCNADYDRCGETSAAHTDVARGRLTGIVGAQADCAASFRRCMRMCRER